MEKDLYKILGVDKNADASKIKKAYRKLAMKYHPDKNPDDKEAEVKFKDVAEAYEILADPDKKRQYDSGGYSSFAGGQPKSRGFQDFEEFFSQVRRQQQRQNNMEQYSIFKRITLTVEEVFNGTKKSFRYDRYDKCKSCDGEGGEDVSKCTNCDGKGVKTTVKSTQFGMFQQTFDCSDCGGKGFVIKNPCNACGGDGTVVKSEKADINIPHSTFENEKLIMWGMGSYYKEDGADKHGDLVLLIRVKEDNFKIVNHYDLLSTIKVDYSTLVLGGKRSFKTIEGNEINVTISESTDINKTLKVKGKGLKNKNSNIRGDQYLNVEWYMPTEVSEKERELLEELKKPEQ